MQLPTFQHFLGFRTRHIHVDDCVYRHFSATNKGVLSIILFIARCRRSELNYEDLWLYLTWRFDSLTAVLEHGNF